MLESYKSTMKPSTNTNALENRRMMKAAMSSVDRPDISQYELTASSSVISD